MIVRQTCLRFVAAAIDQKHGPDNYQKQNSKSIIDRTAVQFRYSQPQKLSSHCATISDHPLRSKSFDLESVSETI